jgi:hypothetical protein
MVNQMLAIPVGPDRDRLQVVLEELEAEVVAVILKARSSR